MGVFELNGNWFIDYRLTDGRRRQEKIGSSKKLAETVLQKRKVAIAEGKYLDIVKKEKITFEVFAQEYLNIHSKQHKKSWITDSFHINELSRHFKGKYLFAITPKDIENFKIERSKTVSSATVNRQLGTLRGLFNKAIAWGKLQASPMKSVQFLKEPQGRLRFLEKEEIIKLLANCNKPLKPIVVLAIFTGMRRGEIFGLKWPDIDFKRNIITLLDTKNGDRREVPMNEQVKIALMRTRRHLDSPYIFCNDKGQLRHDIRKSFSTALRKSGIKEFRFHDLRHTFASQLVMAGVDLNTVRELMGHKDITMTLRYSHLAPSHKQRAVDILGKKVETFWRLESSAAESIEPSFLQNIDNQQLVDFGK